MPVPAACIVFPRCRAKSAISPRPRTPTGVRGDNSGAQWGGKRAHVWLLCLIAALGDGSFPLLCLRALMEISFHSSSSTCLISEGPEDVRDSPIFSSNHIIIAVNLHQSVRRSSFGFNEDSTSSPNSQTHPTLEYRLRLLQICPSRDVQVEAVRLFTLPQENRGVRARKRNMERAALHPC